MPTTRSQGRHEPLQRLETPPKRQRKQRPRRSILAQGITQEPRMRTLSMSPEPEEPPKEEPEVVVAPAPSVTYIDASTQTEEVVVLTQAEVAELKDRANASVSYKRNRDDESEDEPTAKRHQFSTPQNEKPNNLWMFGEKLNGEHPRTAPSKSLARTPLRRQMRGPLSRRTNVAENPRFRVKNSTAPAQVAQPDKIEPIEQNDAEQDIENQTSGSQTQQNDGDAQDTAGHQQYQFNTPQPTTPTATRRGLFGSLRGIVNKGWDIAASLTPRGARTESGAGGQSSTGNSQISYPQLQATFEDDNEVTSSETPTQQNYRENQGRSGRFMPSPRQSPQPSSRYDHLHYISADADTIDKAMHGDIEPPPRPPTPPSPASRIKAQNPKLSDATIEFMLKKRERKAALDEARYGPKPVPEEIQVAPLFGPDSHYARGTVDPRFLPPTPIYGLSQKRKLYSVNGKVPGPKNGGFGIDEEYLDTEVEIVRVDQPTSEEDDDADTRPSKKHKTNEIPPTINAFPSTPRSAMKKPGIGGSIGRKSVAFGESISRNIRGHYGPAGQYKGSTFADVSPQDSRSLSSIDRSDVISPNTRLNTVTNSGKKPASVLDNLGGNIPSIDFTLRDPNDENWRPSLGNPRPGAFRVPDIDEEDPDETMSDDTPEQPQTPRMSHAELPGAPSTIGSVSFNESSIVHESTELALDKARSKAEKYKPKSSSRLSEVSRARSRSTSPDAEDEAEMLTPKNTGKYGVSAPAVQPVVAAPQPFVPRELDNTNRGVDGMTDFEREHQFDEWAANLDWDAPQTYEDAGTGSAYIHNLIRKNWTEDDERRSELFWAREFEEVDRAMKEAQGKGQQLVLVTGMEEIEGY